MTDFITGAHESDTHQKALRINLDPRWYGTIAEIGAGQEVVRWFFRVGAAAPNPVRARRDIGLRPAGEPLASAVTCRPFGIWLLSS